MAQRLVFVYYCSTGIHTGNGSELLLSWGHGTMVVDTDGVVWLTAKEASDYLGISLSRLYHLKDRLTHWKGRKVLLFRRDKLLNEYMKY